jgi:hypothetical protein
MMTVVNNRVQGYYLQEMFFTCHAKIYTGVSSEQPCERKNEKEKRTFRRLTIGKQFITKLNQLLSVIVT